MKTDKEFKKFIKSLLKYNDKNNNYFTAQQISQIFSGWTDLEFNKIHYGIGKGCCTYVGPKPGYQINVAHCNSIAHKFNESKKTTIRILISVLVPLFLFGLGLFLNKINNNTNQHNNSEKPQFHNQNPPK